MLLAKARGVVGGQPIATSVGVEKNTSRDEGVARGTVVHGVTRVARRGSRRHKRGQVVVTWECNADDEHVTSVREVTLVNSGPTVRQKGRMKCEADDSKELATLGDEKAGIHTAKPGSHACRWLAKPGSPQPTSETLARPATATNAANPATC
jgi:hypothetical protein